VHKLTTHSYWIDTGSVFGKSMKAQFNVGVWYDEIMARLKA